MSPSIARWERGLRIGLGFALLGLGWGGVVTGGFGLACKIVGFVPLLTGLMGYCPAYALAGHRPRRT